MLDTSVFMKSQINDFTFKADKPLEINGIKNSHKELESIYTRLQKANFVSGDTALKRRLLI
jgi:hypothetical protein